MFKPSECWDRMYGSPRPDVCCRGGRICVTVCMWVFRSEHWVSAALNTVFNGLLLNLELTDNSQRAPRIHLSLCLLSAAITDTCHCAQLLLGTGDLNSGHYTYVFCGKPFTHCAISSTLYPELKQNVYVIEWWDNITSQSSFLLEPCLLLSIITEC